MGTDWFNVRATFATVWNIATMQILLGFIISYYIVEETDVWSYATTIDQSHDDDKKIRYFYLGALLATVPASYLAKTLGIRWTVLVTTVLFAGLLPVVSVVQQSNNEAFLFLLTLSGSLFGFAQVAIIQGACMVEVIGQFCRMGRFYCLKEASTILGLLAGTSLASSIGHPGAFPSLHTFSIALALIAASAALAFCSMYNRVQELGVRDRVTSWSARRESTVRASLLLQLSDADDEAKAGLGMGLGLGLGASGGRLLHAPLYASDDDALSSGGSVHSGGGGGGGLSFRSYRAASYSSGSGLGGGWQECLLRDARWLLSQWRRPEVRSLLRVAFLASLAVDTLEYWSFSYYQDALGAQGDARQWGVVATRASLCVGYLLSDFVRPVFAMRQWRVVLVCTAGAALGVVLFLAAGGVASGGGSGGGGGSGSGSGSPAALGLATAGSVLVGLFLAPLLPLCVSVSFTLPDMTPGTGVAALLAVGYLSHVVASSLVGALAQAAGVGPAMLTLLSVLLLGPLGRNLPTALCLLIDVDAFQLPVPHGVVMAGDSTARESWGWA